MTNSSRVTIAFLPPLPLLPLWSARREEVEGEETAPERVVAVPPKRGGGVWGSSIEKQTVVVVDGAM